MQALQSHTFIGVKKKRASQKTRENDKIQFLHLRPQVYLTHIFYQSAIVMPLYQIVLHFWIILLQNVHNFDLLN